eukprot:7990980-Pyramimonas_sp.AAC.1
MTPLERPRASPVRRPRWKPARIVAAKAISPRPSAQPASALHNSGGIGGARCGTSRRPQTDSNLHAPGHCRR